MTPVGSCLCVCSQVSGSSTRRSPWAAVLGALGQTCGRSCGVLHLQEVGSEKGRALRGLQRACWGVRPWSSPGPQGCRVGGQEGALAGPGRSLLATSTGAGCVPVVAQRHPWALPDRLGESGRRWGHVESSWGCERLWGSQE